MYRALLAGEADEEEAEEGVGIGVEAGLGVWRIGGAGWAGVWASRTLFVDSDVHRLDGTKARIHEEGDSHGIEKSGRFLAPLVVEKSEGVGERCALAEEESALDFVHFQLRRVQGHDEEGHSGGEELLGGWNVIEDVPFGFRALSRTEPEIPLAALDTAPHDDDALEIAEGGRIFVDSGADVHES